MEWTGEVLEDMSMDSFFRHNPDLPIQDFPKRYRINGAIYLACVTKLIEKNSFFINKSTYAFIMDKFASVDIDTKLDFIVAETLLEKKLAMNC
jgi:CMP-N-acetylneuraminic acid synthetase